MKTKTIILALVTAVLSVTTTHSVLLLHKKRVSLRCQADVMLLELDLQDIPQIKPSSLHLRYSSCQPHNVTETGATFLVPLQGCGTIRATTPSMRGNKDGYITFSNVVENSMPRNVSHFKVSRTPRFQYPFVCYYRQKYVISITERETKNKGKKKGTKKFQKPDGPGETLASAQNELSFTGKAATISVISLVMAHLVLLFAMFIEL